MQDVVLTPTDFVALVNQTLEFVYPGVTVEGELANFRISKNRWVYFSLKDDVSVVSFFGTIYQLPGPLEDGMNVRVVGSPRLHAKFGFSVNVISMAPVGEVAIKKAADLLRAKLEAEGLFEPARKRLLPELPASIGLITAGNSAAYADFIKILNERWGGVGVQFADVYVQGDQAVWQIIRAIEYLNQSAEMLDVLVITRGGGSAEDLAAFNDERLVRAIAASRVPTLVAIGHEVDESLAELAADLRASTPSNAAQLLVPDRKHELSHLVIKRSNLSLGVLESIALRAQEIRLGREYLTSQVNQVMEVERERLATSHRLSALFNPEAALKRGYAIVRKGGKLVTKITQTKKGDELHVGLSDGTLNVITKEVIKNA